MELFKVLFLAIIAMQSLKCEAFVTAQRGMQSTKNLAASKSNGEEEKPDEDLNPFALPPIGSSSFWSKKSEDSKLNEQANANISEISNGIKISDEVASRKFQLQYTCKICETRNSIKVTRIAYRKGIVIAKCQGCENKHLIADNLNWLSGFDYDNGETNIEQFMQNRNEESGGGKEDLVVRVDKEVFDLEKVLYKGPDADAESVLTSLDDEDNLDHWN